MLYMKRLSCVGVLLFLFLTKGSAQHGNYWFNAEMLGGYITSGDVPFWLRSNQYGSIPVDKASVSLIGSAKKVYDPSKKGIFDWGTSLEGRLNVGYKTNITLIEGYAKMKLGIFEITAGREKSIIGLCDTILTSGSWSTSGNAAGVPKVEISIPEFYTIPWFGQLFAIKGQFAHGWFGQKLMFSFLKDTTMNLTTYLHQKSLYGRFGKPEWRWKLYGGLNHQVLWGSEKEFYTEDFTLSTLSTYYYVITGKRYNGGKIQSTRLGDQLGSLDIGAEYEFNKCKVLIYRQNVYDAGALAHLANIQDGLNGLSIENKSVTDKVFKWKRFLFEFLYTKNQAGESWSRNTPSAYESYYNHGEYIQGWSYNGTGLGNPFITPRTMNEKNLPSSPHEFFINNRIRVFHIGFQGSVKHLDYLLRSSWSNNYGTYYTTNEKQSTDLQDAGDYGIFGDLRQFSAYFECERKLNNGIILGGIVAFDIGELFNNSFGIMLHASRSF
jgi:hypothetical protein